MITKITTQYFKRFETQEFPLEPLTLLAEVARKAEPEKLEFKFGASSL